MKRIFPLIAIGTLLLVQGCATDAPTDCRPEISKEACAAAVQEQRRRIVAFWDYWIKEGGGEAEKVKIWLACWGNKDGSWGPPEHDYLDRFIRPGETRSSHAPHSRAFDAFQRCLIKEGLRWTGECTEHRKRWLPACGAP